MTKFHKVNAALIHKTEQTKELLFLAEGRSDIIFSSKFKYHTFDFDTFAIKKNFKSLNEVIKHYELTI